jgi:hypothetical protein
MAELVALDVATKRHIRKTPKLVDMIFQGGPMAAYAKQNLVEEFDGGRLIAENFTYNGQIGGFYAKGKEFNISEPQVEQQCQFNMRFIEVNVTISKEDNQVLNKGDNAAFRLIESRMQNAYMTAGAFLELAMYLNGQRANYTAMFNGMAEALNDNATVSWDNALYSQYGGITRGGAVGNALNSVPVDVNGTIEYTGANGLEETYAAASYGPDEWEPNLGATTYFCYSFIKEKFQTQQKFNDTQDPKIGFNGMKFNTATIIRSRYCPGAYLFGSNGTADPVAVTLFRESTNAALVAYPAPVGGYPAAGTYSETLWWVNARRPFFNFYVSDDPEFGWGFTGWKPGQGNTKLAGQVLASCQITLAPRYHKQLYRITG